MCSLREKTIKKQNLYQGVEQLFILEFTSRVVMSERSEQLFVWEFTSKVARYE